MRSPLAAAALLKVLLATLMLLFAAGNIGDAARSAGHTPPAKENLTHVDYAGGETILPNGRRLTPRGTQLVVPPHPYALALAGDGHTLLASCDGTGPFALAVVDGADGSSPRLTTLSEAQESDFKSTYQGVALAPDGRTAYISGGNDGRVHIWDLPSRRRIGTLALNAGSFGESIAAQMALTRDGRRLLVVDQGNWRLVVFDTAARRILSSIRTGRTPFALTLSQDERRAYVANAGLFKYRTVEKAAGKDPRGLAFPPFGYPSREAREGAVVDGRRVPGLGKVNGPESYSVWGVDLANPAAPQVDFRVNTGIPISYGAGIEDNGDEDEDEVKGVVGGSIPCALVARKDRIYVANANNDSLQALDSRTGSIRSTLNLGTVLPEPLRALRGMTPYGLALSPDGSRLYAALAGFNAVAVIDAAQFRLLGLIPAGWYPSRVAVSPDGRRLYVANAKGHGSGPNAGKQFKPGADGSTSIGKLMRGTLSLMDVPADRELPALTRQVLANNGADRAPEASARRPQIRHIVFITKENRTFDEVFGALPGVRGDPSLARFGSPQPAPSELPAGPPLTVMPNHLALARRFAISDNFYVDSDHSADGHRWLAAVPPNHWTESIVSAAYGGQMDDNSASRAPGRRPLFGSDSAVAPEDYLEAGTLWHHLARHRVSFRNWGEGFELAGIDEGPGLKPTGARLPLNIPMPQPLFRRTARDFPTFNMNIPDQYRADVFLREFRERYESGKHALPRYSYLYLPNDHGARPRPKDGYPAGASYQADNDLALGRVLEALSRSRYWREMAVFVTEDDAQGGVDSVDAHRSVLMVLSPWVKRGYVSRRHTDISAIHHGIFDLLRLPPLSLYDALAGDLSDFWSETPDFTPYSALTVDARLFDPAKAKDPLDPDFRRARAMRVKAMDDPDEVLMLRRREGLEH